MSGKKEWTYNFNVQIAIDYKDVNIATIVNHFDFWIKKNKADGRNYYDGKWWTYSTVKDLCKHFPWLPESRLRYLLKKMEKEKIIITGNYNKSPFDRTKWYTFTDEFREKYRDILQSEGIEPGNPDSTNSSNPSDKNENSNLQNRHFSTDKNASPIPDNNTDTNTQINKPDISKSAPQSNPPNPSPTNSQSTKAPDLPPDIGDIHDWLSWSLEDFRAVWKRHGKQLERSHPRYAGVIKYIGAHLKYLGTTPSPVVVERLVNIAAPDYWITGAVDEMIATLRNGGDPKNFNLERFYRILRKYEQMNLPTDRNPYKYLEERRQERKEDAVKL